MFFNYYSLTPSSFPWGREAKAEALVAFSENIRFLRPFPSLSGEG